MRDLRTSTALRQLNDLSSDLESSPWAWAVARLDRAGRLLLPVEARAVLGVQSGLQTRVRGVCHRVVLVLSADGAGAALTVDSRGRLCVPAWLRRGAMSSLVVGTNHANELVVVAPTTVLDGLGDVLVGESR
jgi:bifunctional DNA-binding transcriptional regulator/antitoxin component of YhaV-PrlF toxin-antitoxin module